MADVDIQKITAIFEASLSQYEKELNRARGLTNRMMDHIETRGDRMGRSLGNIGRGGSFLAPLIGRFAALLSPILLVQAAIHNFSQAAEIGKFADRVGLGVEKLQELRFGFTLAGVDVQQFNRAIEEFNSRIGQAANGNTRLAQILRANGIAIRDSNGEIRSSEELLRIYADLIANARTQQERFVLATEAFGGDAGRKIVAALRSGSRGLEEMSQKARDAGAVLNEGLVRDAEQMATEYKAQIARIEKAWQEFFVRVTKGSKNVLDAVFGPRSGGILPPMSPQLQQRVLQGRSQSDWPDVFAEGLKLQKLYTDLSKFQMNRANQPSALMEQVESDLLRQIEETKQRIITDLKDGVKATEALGNALNKVANKLLDMSLTQLTNSWFGAGSGANIFRFLIPGLAAGGTAHGGRPHLVGEEGPELFVPGRTGTIIPNHGLARVGSGRGVTIAMSNDFRDSSSPAIAALSQRIDRLEANLPRIIRQVQTMGRANEPFYGAP